MMMRQWFLFGLVLGLLVCACAGSSGPYAYYTLHAVDHAPQTAQDQTADRLVIGLGPVSLPDYLDRTTIVTRVSPNRLAVNDGHRWAGPLQAEILRVLAADLGNRIHAGDVVAYPWSGNVSPDLRFRVDIKAFEGRRGETVRLKAAWTMTPSQSDQPAVRRVSHIEEKVSGFDFEALAAAMGKALDELSAEMTSAVSKATNSQ